MTQSCMYVVGLYSTFVILACVFVANSIIERSSTERSSCFEVFEDHVLQNHVFATYPEATALECAAKCIRDHGCLSFNFKPINDEDSNCHLNNANRITCPECYVIEPDTTYHEDLQRNNCLGRDGELSNYDLYFPQKGLTSFVNQTWSVNLIMFTICFWMQTVDTGQGALFSYAVPDALNEVTIFKEDLAIDNKERDISLGNYYDGSRHHVCVRWENSAGAWNMTVNGTVIDNGSGLKKNHEIRGGGYLTIGQEQDSTPGDPRGFALHQSFMGNISGMNVWSRVLTGDEILRMSKTCNLGNGDVLKWSDFLISRHGDVVVNCPSGFIENCNI